MGDADFAWLEGLRRRHYPPGLNRVPAHLTLFSHLPPSLESELKRRLSRHAAAPAPLAILSAIMDLDGGTALRVESAGLEEIREDLAQAFHGLLVPSDSAPWRPHVTIQNKVEPRAARRLQAELATTFRTRPLALRGFAVWSYRGGPWQSLGEYRFRG